MLLLLFPPELLHPCTRITIDIAKNVLTCFRRHHHRHPPFFLGGGFLGGGPCFCSLIRGGGWLSLMNVGCHDALQRLSSYHVVNDAAKLEPIASLSHKVPVTFLTGATRFFQS